MPLGHALQDEARFESGHWQQGLAALGNLMVSYHLLVCPQLRLSLHQQEPFCDQGLHPDTV